jgi:hypothetical protein
LRSVTVDSQDQGRDNQTGQEDLERARFAEGVESEGYETISCAR